jgi:hypothetical protein
MVKQRADKGHLTGVEGRVIYGNDTTLTRTGTRTVYIERTNLPSPLMNARLVRKTLGFCKRSTMLRAACIWEDATYNLTRPSNPSAFVSLNLVSAAGFNVLRLWQPV